MIQAVLFDIGGVILRTEDLGPRRKWEARFGLPDWGLAEVVFNNPVSMQATLGQASLEGIWDEVARQLALQPAEVAELREDFWKGDAYDADLLAFIRSLRPRLKTGIISNAWPGVREYHQARLGADTFDVLVYSSEEGVAKPDPEIYRRALVRLGVQPVEAIFVDDMLANVEGARAVGMHGVHFSDPLKAQSEIAQLLQTHNGQSPAGRTVV